MLSYGPVHRTSQGPLLPSWVQSSAPESPSSARPCRGCPHTAHPFGVHGAHLINRKLVPVKLGNWHQMQLVLSLWGVLNSCFLKFFFSLEAEILKIVIGMPRFIVLHGYSVTVQIEGLWFLCKVCSNLNLLRSVLQPRIQSVLVTGPCSLVKNVL